MRGHEKIVELLLSQGADVNAQGSRVYGNALQASSMRGHEKTVELLLSRGARIRHYVDRPTNSPTTVVLAHSLYPLLLPDDI